MRYQVAIPGSPVVLFESDSFHDAANAQLGADEQGINSALYDLRTRELIVVHPDRLEPLATGRMTADEVALLEPDEVTP